MDKGIRTVSANGLKLPALGQGTWYMGDERRKEESEIAALRLGLELGLRLIDTAEMYGEGRSEILIGKAINGLKRDRFFLTSKVYPYNAGKRNIFASCDNSLKRLGTDYLDLYLLHWRGSVPLSETVECMEALVKAEKIRRWGVSNFDIADMEELWRVPNGSNCAVNQVLYNLGSRGIEYDLIPWLRAHNVAAMAYCPLAQAGSLRRKLLSDPTLLAIAKKYGIGIMQLLLVFLLRQENVIAIPKSGSPQHVRDNAQALEISISIEDWNMVDQAFPPPSGKMQLDMV
jgi:diketogulonate reductase-like aldo/keto reductase